MKNKTTFGNFAQPTPKWARLLFNIFTAISGVLSIVVVTFSDEIPDSTETLLLKIAAVSVPIMRVFTKSFGVTDGTTTTN